MKQGQPEIAKLANMHRTIPRSIVEIAVTGTSASAAGALLAYAGEVIWLRAVTATVTIALGSRTVIAGKGLDIKTTDYTELFVDPADSTFDLSHISTGAATLQILYG